ncbi:uncharacterized protein B0H18DRAFT_1115261 [Fomitopsis serialis]|uniref:uncharacterized protein n=1 Tax=Fomitopsis serialis TaxID=139415 RepID=UPI0020077FE6|nr:uncharacterized protein B0H18DRAFT_1115261 [Neoantrodia serialis]KAH9933903.1 hypothetical protein B0H18DRAFT_1115261 [Neoantrodia serialis]
MVSSQPPSISRPTVSYADRAKGLQVARAKNGPTIPRPPQPPSSASSTSGTTASTNMIASKPTPLPSVETPTPSATHPSSSSHPLPAPATTIMNGDVKLPSADSPRSAPQDEVASTSSPAQKLAPPPTNVWNRRMEQMAQTRAKSGQASSQPPRPPPSPQNPSPSPQNTHQAAASSGSTLQNVTNNAQAPPVIVANGTNNGHRQHQGDAFVVRPRTRVPLVDDVESWPEVGKAVSSGSGQSDPDHSAKGQEKGDTEGEHTSAPTRKSEKPKWVPIPATELQAAHDAQQRAQNIRNRSSQHLNAHPRSSNQGSSSASGSGPGSQGQSRTQSVAGGARQSASGSHAGSVSQSQTQSRTGSTQSSPPGAFARGGRRLPEESMTYPAGASRSISMRSSRTGSPQTFHPTLPPPPEAVASTLGYRGIPPSLGRRGSGQGEQDQTGIPPYYVPMPPRSYHSPHPSDSPAHPPYALPPIAPVPTLYSTPGLQPPQSVPFSGTPPYPMYSPYGYPYPPYMFWQPGTSPVAPEGVPPPMMLGRPPLSGENESTALYREPGQGEQRQRGAVERGRRTRELSFGTIDAEVEAGQPDEELGVLGLRLTSEEPQEATTTKPTPPFAIGVAPGETGPARIRRVPIPKVVIDLTEPGETKWEFGTTSQDEAEVIAEVGPRPAHVNGTVQPAPSHPGPALGVTRMDAVPPPFVHPSAYAPPPTLPPIITTTNGLAPAHSPSMRASALPPLSASDVGQSDDLRVKDYGYGFGRKNYGPLSAGGERRDWQGERPPEREYYGRSRRGSFGGYGYDRGGHERGGYPGRRGRGGGRGYEGRGTYHARTHSRGGGYQGRQPPFSAQQPASVQTDVNGYYAPPPQGTTYYSPAYEPYAAGYPAPPANPPILQNMPSGAPLPMPVTPLSFPLDSVRYYLLGQLEYYLSTDNMAQDFFLRQQMDSRGWISIPLLASFKRVQQLTTSLQLVKDVLALSSLVEVRDDHVRMHQCAQFILPNAPESTVEALAYDGSFATVHGEEPEEEEEDVVFVLERPAAEA